MSYDMIDCTILRAGNGLHYAQDGERVVVHYKMSLAKTGKLVHSSFKKMKPFIFQVGVGQVIPGWDAAVKQLSKGECAQFVIPAAMGYGSKGVPGLILPNADLSCEVEVMSISAVSD